MAANVLNSDRAIKVSVQLIRAFIKLRQILATNSQLASKLNSLEQRYDHQFKIVFDAIRRLMTQRQRTSKADWFPTERFEEMKKRKICVICG